MVDDRKPIWVWNECERDKAVNEAILRSTVLPQAYVEIPELVSARSKDLSVASLLPIGAEADAVHAAHTTKVADFVEATEISDRNRSPFFRESDIHVTGCPSGNGGSTIKDPSHASTFGGSAIMASASANYNRRLRFL